MGYERYRMNLIQVLEAKTHQMAAAAASQGIGVQSQAGEWYNPKCTPMYSTKSSMFPNVLSFRKYMNHPSLSA